MVTTHSKPTAKKTTSSHPWGQGLRCPDGRPVNQGESLRIIEAVVSPAARQLLARPSPRDPTTHAHEDNVPMPPRGGRTDVPLPQRDVSPGLNALASPSLSGSRSNPDLMYAGGGIAHEDVQRVDPSRSRPRDSSLHS